MKFRPKFALLGVLALANGHCSKGAPQAGENQAAPNPSSATSPRSIASTGTSAVAAPAKSTATYAGTYASRPGTLFVPDGGEWSGVRWRGDDAGAGLGEGTLTISIDQKTSRADGTAEGPIGPASVSGMLDGTRLSFTITRKDIDTDGFYGSATGALAGDTISGVMTLSLAYGNVIREATFSLKKK